MFSLFTMIPCSSQTISNDSVYVMTAEELKLTNQIFAEHEYLTEKVELMEREILAFNTLVSEYEKEDSIKAQIIKNQETSIKKLKKSNKVKNTLITGFGSGFLVSLILLICGK